ncbi:MAG: aminodeoxychorismate lyase [Acidiferrobacterales bacterium]
MTWPPVVLVNGETTDCVPVQDRGFQYGDGVFETIAVYRCDPLLWQQHLARLKKGCERLLIGPPDAAQLREEARALCEDIERAVLKIIITRGISGRGYAPGSAERPTRVLALLPWPDYPLGYAQDGVSVRVCRTRVSRNPLTAGIKHLNRLEQVLARAEWESEFVEGLMLDEDDNIVEATAANVFVVSEGTLLTPELSHYGVEGVMRGAVLEQARCLTLPHRVGPITRATLDKADEIFLTNSLIGIWPVTQIQSRAFPVGPTTRRLQQAIMRTPYVGDTA